MIPLHRAVFLDRDGVINYNRENHIKSWDEFTFLPGIFEPLGKLARSDYAVIVISNQAAIGRGLVGEKAVEEINRRMVDEITTQGGRIDSVFICPHRPDENCGCRKPAPGLILQAAQQQNLDLAHSFLIGDALSDVEAALAAGCQPILVLTGRGSEQRLLLDQSGYLHLPVKCDLAEAVDWILQQ